MKLPTLAAICADHNVRHFIISPGSRSAPLTIALARTPDISVRMVMDERAAAFIALGMAQQTRAPVGLVCTSGTATLNYAPAIAEAFYQRVPLLIFTADRPPEWIDQQDGQTLHQQNLYAPHTRGEFQLPVDFSHPDARWHAERILSEAIIRTQHPVPGPVHINVPLREPLYPAPGKRTEPSPRRQIIRQPATVATLPPTEQATLAQAWQSARKKLIVAGLHPPAEALAQALAALATDPTVTVVADIAANVPPVAVTAPHADMIFSTKVAPVQQTIAPDLVVSFGGAVVSKSLKLFLRRHRPPEHWHVDPAGQTVDTFQSLTRVVPLGAAVFFAFLAELPRAPVGSYHADWQSLEKAAQSALDDFLHDAAFGEFLAVARILPHLPTNSNLHLSNSMPVRYANTLALPRPDVQVNANRGVSGIDGCTSTAVGAALATDRPTVLISGDLAFFYDRNALWHNHIPSNLRIVLLNNGGGGIFKLIDGPSNLPSTELETYFFTPHGLTARNTAADFGLAYFSADTAAALDALLPHFFAPDTGAAILEIFTDSAVNTAVFRAFKKVISFQSSVF